MSAFIKIISLTVVIFSLGILSLWHEQACSRPTPEINNTANERWDEFSILKMHASSIKKFTTDNHYNPKICFLIDMKIASGKKRFFVYDLRKDSILSAGLVAHGCCDNGFQPEANFSNKINSGCSSMGKFRIGKSYHGRFGLAFKLYGLDSSNNNAFERKIVLHSYSCVPDEEIYPLRPCNSRGCPMVSINFLQKLKMYIEKSPGPVLLAIFK